MDAPNCASPFSFSSPPCPTYVAETCDDIIYLPSANRERVDFQRTGFSALLKEGRGYLQWEALAYFVTEAAALAVVTITLMRVLT